MFGIGKNNSSKKPEYDNDERIYIPAAINNTFGTTNPRKINKIWHEYMPEITNAILGTDAKTANLENHVIQQGKNQVAINENINLKHDEVMEELRLLRLQNQELQAKYDALVERMAGYIERENGKGR